MIQSYRAYSNVQPDTKCVVGKEICAVKNQILCSYFLRPNCINQFCRESVKFRDNSPGFIVPPPVVREKFCLENCCYYPPRKFLLLPPSRKREILGKHPLLFPPGCQLFKGSS